MPFVLEELGLTGLRLVGKRAGPIVLTGEACGTKGSLSPLRSALFGLKELH